ncbi:Kelch repeat-containing protein [Maribacter halichondriae]|uniref:Kelch repeat-containing protein n=1 Tax=Maribacter halichondriae TaxID=2980554 RepID=UPI00235892ED|nr:kelch repeat-containing protein [Maribacter sp. Hal144]
MRIIKKILVLALALIAFSCEKPQMESTDFGATDFKSIPKTKKKSLKAKLVTKGASFEKRTHHTATSFKGKIWVIGGRALIHNAGAQVKNDIWQSKDGNKWIEVKATGHFAPRMEHSTTVFNNKLWVIGGRAEGDDGFFNPYNDIWQSSDGKNWKKVMGKAPFPARHSHTTLVYDNALWVIGGIGNDGWSKTDVWHSKNGIDWVEVTPSTPALYVTLETAFVYNGYMWVVSGFTSATNNEVWYSKNGINWTLATENPAFGKVQGHTSLVYDDKMWVLGGYDSSLNAHNKVWCSKNGKNWNAVSHNGKFKRRSHASVVYDKAMWIIAGIGELTENDVWRLE